MVQVHVYPEKPGILLLVELKAATETRSPCTCMYILPLSNRETIETV